MLASGVQPSDSVIYIHESILFQVIFQFIITEYWTSFPVISWFLLVQFSSVTQLCLTLCDPMDCNTLGFPVHHQLLELAQTHIHWVSEALQPSHPLSYPLLLLPSIFPSIRVFSNESVLHIRWPVRFTQVYSKISLWYLYVYFPYWWLEGTTCIWIYLLVNWEKYCTIEPPEKPAPL